MNTVHPITRPELLDAIKDYLKQKSDRDYFLFVMGINVGLRINDMLPLKVRDVRDRSQIVMREKKTRKEKFIPINATLKKEIDRYTKDMKPDDYLFPSRQLDDNNLTKPITRERAYQILQDVAQKFNLEQIGCHSMRKTFGYHMYKKTKDIALLMYIFNHSTEAITMRYIGMNQKHFENAMKGFGL